MNGTRVMTAAEWRRANGLEVHPPINRLAAPKANKYHAVRTEYAGVKYDSKAEAAWALRFDLELKAGTIQAVKRQVEIPLYAGIILRLDFVVTMPGGSHRFIDVKGVETPVFKLKRRMFRELYKPADIEVVK